MSRVFYLAKRVFSINCRQMFSKVREVKLRSGKSSVYILFDMLACGIKYQAGYMDYALFEMYSLNSAQRKTIVTRGINNSLIKRFNNPAYTDVFDDKRKFNRAFDPFLNRRWLDLEASSEEDFEKFLKVCPNFMAKPANGMCGKGIERLCVSEFDSFHEIKSYLRYKNLYLLEEIVSQHPVMSELHPHSVNTCRVVTITRNGKTNVAVAYLRIGNGKHVDNFNSCGMVAPVNEESGVVSHPATNKQNEIFETHPLTGVAIKGFTIPMWQEVLTLARKAGAVVPQVGLVGWDIALTEKGPLIIEGNNFPGHDIYSLPPHRTNGIGVLPKLKKAINGL